MAGTASLNLGGDGAPTNPNMPVADMAASLMALSAILMLLLKRETTGQGDYIDISMQDALMAWLPNVTGPVFAENRAPVVQNECSFGGYAFFRPYETADGKHIALGGVEHKFVETLLTALDRLDLIPVAKGPPGSGQQAAKDFLNQTFLQKTRDEWEAWFEGRDVCFAPILDLHEAFHRPHVTARKMLTSDAEGNLHIGLPIKFRNDPGKTNFHPPKLGEHTSEVLRQYGVAEVDTQAVLRTEK